MIAPVNGKISKDTTKPTAIPTLNPLGLTYRYDADRMLVEIVPAK